MSKMGLHGLFGYLQHKLWPKKRSRVKLAVWLSTTKSSESTRPRCVQVECDRSLKSSRVELQFFFIPHPNRRFEQRVMTSQSPGSPNQDIFGILPWEPRDKKPIRCGCRGEDRVYYMGEGGGFPESGPWWVLWVHSCPWLVLTLKVLQKVN